MVTQRMEHCHPNCHQIFKAYGLYLLYPDMMHMKHLGTDLVLLGGCIAGQ